MNSTEVTPVYCYNPRHITFCTTFAALLYHFDRLCQVYCLNQKVKLVVIRFIMSTADILPTDGQSDYENSDIVATTHDTDIVAEKNIIRQQPKQAQQPPIPQQQTNNPNRVFADLKIQDLQDSSWNEQQIDLDNELNLNNSNLDDSHLNCALGSSILSDCF